MTTLINYVISLIMSFFLGVSYIQPEDKPFLQGSYFQEEIGQVNYTQLYETMNSADGSKQKCNTGTFMFNTSTGRSRVQDATSNGYLFYATTSDTIADAKANTDKDSSLSAYIFKVPAGTEIIAPYKCKLVNTSLETYVNMFPDDKTGKSMGVNIQVITEPKDNGDQFRITFGSIARHWCCMGKTSKDDYVDKSDETTGYYKHTCETNRNYTFDAGDVIAEAGQSGVTKSVRAQEKDSYIYVKIEKKTILGGVFTPATIADLYS